MANDFEDEKSEGIDLQLYLGVVRRRHLPFLILVFLGWAVVWGASWVLPARYQSSTLILVTQPTMPKDYVTPNVNEDLQERLQSITQQILSRTRLLRIIDQFNLYNSQHAQRSPDDKVEAMRRDIEIELVKDEHKEISSFNVSYTSRDPHVAQKITSELTNLFINENIEVRQEQSENTTKFLEDQLETARQALAAQEDKVRQFKALHVGEMPEQLTSNLQILGGLQQQLQREEDALGAARQQQVYLQTLVDQYRALQGSSKGTDGLAPVGLPELDQQLDKLNAQLADLLSHYTDRHPDVRKVKAQIAETERTRDRLLTSLKKKDQGSTESKDTISSSSPVPDKTQVSLLPQTESQLRSTKIEIANHEHTIASLKAKVDDYQVRLNQEPIREQQLADLTRGYDQSKANYDELLKKKNESEMATKMEIAQQGERFTVLDPPSFPEKPQFPNRLKFCAIGLGIGLALGAGFVAACEMMDNRVHSDKQLRKLLPPNVIVEIPAIVSDADAKSANRKLWLGWCTAAVLFMIILAGSAFSYLRG